MFSVDYTQATRGGREGLAEGRWRMADGVRREGESMTSVHAAPCRLWPHGDEVYWENIARVTPAQLREEANSILFANRIHSEMTETCRIDFVAQAMKLCQMADGIEGQ